MGLKPSYNRLVFLLPVCLITVVLSCSSGWARDAGKDHAEGKTWWEYLKGEPTENQLYLGMFTYHFDPKSRRIRNWNQDLIGFQYNGVFVGTLINSYYKRTWAIGFSRNFYTKELGRQWDLALGGRLGLVYGYKGDEAPLSDISPIIPMIELYEQFVYRKHYGIELMLTTSLSLGFFYQF